MKLSKRIASTALAGALALSMATPAFASGRNVEITSTFQEQVISVTVPSTGTAQINPYGLDIAIEETGKALKGQQIAMQPLAIVNGTKMDLAVSATVTGEATGDLILSSEAPARDAVTKSAYVFLQMKTEPTLVEAKRSTADGNIQGFDAATIANAFETWAAVKKPGANDIVLGPVAASKSNIITLKACSPNATDATKLELQAGSVGLMRLAGVVVKSPITPWATTDGFTANVALTFAPAPTPKTGVTATITPATGASVTSTSQTTDLTVTVADADTDKIEIAKVDWVVTAGSDLATIAVKTAYSATTMTEVATVTRAASVTTGGSFKVKAIVTDIDGATYEASEVTVTVG